MLKMRVTLLASIPFCLLLTRFREPKKKAQGLASHALVIKNIFPGSPETAQSLASHAPVVKNTLPGSLQESPPKA